MRRSLRHSATVFSLALLLLALTFWIRSHWITDIYGLRRYKHPSGSYIQRTSFIAASRGTLIVGQTRSWFTDADVLKYKINTATLTNTSTYRSISPAMPVTLFGNTSNSREWSFAGFDYGSINPGDPSLSGWNLAIPFWAIVLLTALVPLRWLFQRRRTAASAPVRADGAEGAGDSDGMPPTSPIPSLPLPAGAPPVLEYQTPVPKPFVLLPGPRLSSAIAALLCWLPIGLTLALLYRLWTHPATTQPGYPALFICFLAAPILWFARLTLYPPARYRQPSQRPHRLLLFSLLTLVFSLVLCIEMILRG